MSQCNSIQVNGNNIEAPEDARVSLLDLLRETLQLHGTKKGCNQGACGSCTGICSSLSAGMAASAGGAGTHSLA